uniref:DNA-directed RNA polymerase n=1 Tax=Termitomyces sp. K1Ag TaxID=1075695 RepID=A0A8F1D5H6_9AGAR|nr:RNA polymerase [Termitomyces sp. K1Ag]
MKSWKYVKYITIISFTQAELIKNPMLNQVQYSSIASSFLLLKKPKFDFLSGEMYWKLRQNYLGKDLFIFVIPSIEDSIGLKTEVSYILPDDLRVESNYRVIRIPYNQFYRVDEIKRTFIDNGHLDRCIFLFENLYYREIVSNLAMFNLFISGGSNSLKHSYSPVQSRLGRFLMSWFEDYEFDELMRLSFTHKNKEIKYLNWRTKDIRKLLGEFTEVDRFNFVFDKDKLKEDLAKKIAKLKSKSTENNLTSIKESEEGTATGATDISSDSTQEESSGKIVVGRGNSSNNTSTSINLNNSFSSKKNKSFSVEPFPSSVNGIKREIHTFSNLKYNSATAVKVAETDTEGINYPISRREDRKNKKSQSHIFSFFNFVKNIIDDSKLEPEKAQAVIESKWLDITKEYFDNDQNLVQNNPNKIYPLLLEAKKSLDILEKNKRISRKFSSNLINKNLNRMELILLTFSYGITYSNRLSYTKICQILGDQILYYLFRNTVHEYETWAEYSFKVKEIESPEFSIYLGDFFMNLLSVYPHDIFERINNPASFYTKETASLIINPTYLEDIRKNLILLPYTLPMICKPNEWSEKSFGGFLENKIKEVSIITGSSRQGHKVENKEALFKAINYLNSIQFGINNLLLDYLSKEGKYLLEDMKSQDDVQRDLTLEIARLFSKVPFYLNVNADWRGRLYTRSFFITYQGGDLSSALLNFWKGESLTEDGLNFLYIHGANNHNENQISKASFEDRIQWVKNNYKKIVNLDKSLILSAEKPFIFLAFCLNMKKLDKDRDATIYTPVFLDATCSGIQHLAALLLDSELANSVNLTDYYINNKPNDIYVKLLGHINMAINEFGEENPEFANLALVKLNRKEVKESIMTKVYNVSKYGMAQQLQSKFKVKINPSLSKEENIASNLEESLLKKNKKNKKKQEKIYYTVKDKNNKVVFLSKKDIFQIATIIDQQIFVVYPSLNNIYSYFLNMSKIMVKLGIPITWITPAGMKITQNYLKSKQSIISISLFNVRKKMVLREYSDETDNQKQNNAIIPNIIHSLDATHLINLINKNEKEKLKHIITIHDCFGTHPNSMGELSYRVRIEFIALYLQENFLETFHQRLIQSIKDNNFEIFKINPYSELFVRFDYGLIKVPDIPKLGDLDLKKILSSKYMIN